MKAEFKVELLPSIKNGRFKVPDALYLAIKDRHDAAIIIDAIHRKISDPSNEEINIYLLGEYVRTKED